MTKKRIVEAAVVEVREVEARAEDAAAGVPRVADDRAADDADLDLGIEQREVDGDLGRRQRVAVLRIQVAVVSDLEVRERGRGVRDTYRRDRRRRSPGSRRGARAPHRSGAASTRRDASRSAARRARRRRRGPGRSRSPSLSGSFRVALGCHRPRVGTRPGKCSAAAYTSSSSRTARRSPPVSSS